MSSPWQPNDNGDVTLWNCVSFAATNAPVSLYYSRWQWQVYSNQPTLGWMYFWYLHECRREREGSERTHTTSSDETLGSVAVWRRKSHLCRQLLRSIVVLLAGGSLSVWFNYRVFISSLKKKSDEVGSGVVHVSPFTPTPPKTDANAVKRHIYFKYYVNFKFHGSFWWVEVQISVVVIVLFCQH